MKSRHDVSPAEADEALNDVARLTLDPDPASKSGFSVRVIGWAESTGRLLTIITMTRDRHIYGVNGWESNPIDRRKYNTREPDP